MTTSDTTDRPQNTDADATDSTDPSNDVQAGGNEGGPKQLREARDRALERAADAEAKLERIALESLGLDPDKGTGKAAKMIYDGAIEPDKIEEFKEFLADEFDYVPGADASSARPDTSDAIQRVNALTSDARHSPDDTPQTRQAKAEAEGDIEGAILAGLSTLDFGLGG